MKDERDPELIPSGCLCPTFINNDGVEERGVSVLCPIHGHGARDTQREADTEYQKERNALLKKIPKEYRDGAATHAWNEGHAYGYKEVLFHLQNIVTTIFKK